MVFIQAFHLDENTPSNLWGWNLRLKASTKVPKQGTFFQGKIVEGFLPLGNLGGNVSGFFKIPERVPATEAFSPFPSNRPS